MESSSRRESKKGAIKEEKSWEDCENVLIVIKAECRWIGWEAGRDFFVD